MDERAQVGVGLKPTLGLVSTTGVVPACRSYDTVSVFGANLTIATAALRTIAQCDPHDARSRTWPADAPLAAPRSPRLAIPAPPNLTSLDRETARDFATARERLASLGLTTVEVDIDPLFQAARLLYDGALVAERAEAFGEVAAQHPGELDPVVEKIVAAACKTQGAQVIRDQHHLLAAKRHVRTLFRDIDILLVPTSPIHPTTDAVADDPIGLNSTIGTFTNFVNLLDLCAVAIPGLPEQTTTTTDGITLIGPAFHDQVLLDVGARILGEQSPLLPPGGTEVAIFGAHMSGQPLNHELEQLGARHLGEITTSNDYRMIVLDMTPPRPAIVPAPGTGAVLRGELWRIPTANVGTLVTDLFKPPLGLGHITTANGSSTLACVGIGATGEDITATGNWAQWLHDQEER
ncbi:amidase family protein [Luteococcus sanguinis]|uniref:Amidase family protein n=1 Tax=Luteococcus sanguinis TaxID=174038 RepID=A0ABW1X2U0_9ACTN